MLKLDIKKPRKFISPLLSKKSITTNELTQFEESIRIYLDELENHRITKQSEPNIVSNVLKPFFTSLGYVANSYSQKGQSGIDLALMLNHNPAVIIEAKAHGSSAMISKHDINKKSLHEAILYFMRERDSGNNMLYHIIITDFYHWFIFDAKDFDRLFWKNKEIKKVFMSVKDPSVLGDRTEDFYSMVSGKIEQMMSDLINDQTIECAYFNLNEKRNEKEFMALYKLLSKNTLLKEFNPNDANTLNREFYSELLYILGLEEQSIGSKKLISRAKSQHKGALYENIVEKLIQYGKPTDFESVIRLMIIWINRILFLKLLESQLILWNDSKEYAFLNAQKIKDFDRLEMLFFDILAKQPHDRGHREFDYVPYLNSSLFEPHAFEQKFLTIATLQDDCDMPYYSKTVLKDIHANRKEGNINMLHYLFEFLDAYDFSSEGSEEIVSETKSLINASVLGLIFEKLNGYKDGSFYTPSFITMYMSKETITKAIISKFNQIKDWNCVTLDELDDKIEDKKEANAIIDSLTICDPAVGSGHFLVSSLNTILEIKSKLRVLFDEDGRRIKDYEFTVENDELIVRDDEGEIFEYKRGFKEKTRIQKMIFYEKQKIIENSLFGVDINPNSAHITRLRLWIELLKNSYYAEDTHLVTMPNIDINIKVGNSLISRYDLYDEIDIPNNKDAIERYKTSVKEYKEGSFLTSKEDIRSAIEEIKGIFGQNLQSHWTQTQKYKKLLGEYVKTYSMDGLTRNMQLDALDYNYGYHGNLFDDELSESNKKEKAKLFEKVQKSAKEIEEIEKGKIYEDAFEWRIEFPEVLDEEGNFIGFDVVIGNPPYGLFNKKQNKKTALEIDKLAIDLLKQRYPEATGGVINAARIFYALSLKISSKFAFQCMIIPYGVLTDTTSVRLRKHIFNNHSLINVDAFPERDNTKRRVFEDVKMSTAILLTSSIKKDSAFSLGISYDRSISNNRANFKTQDLIDLNPDLVQIPLTDTKSFELLSKIYKTKNILKLGSISPCLTGEVDMTFAKAALTSNNHNSLLLKGVQIDRFIMKTEQNDISQGDIEFINFEIFSEIGSVKKINDSKNKRIALQGLTGVNERNRIKATLIDENIFLANSCNYILKPEKYDIELLLGWLNSSLLNFVFKTRSTSSNVNGYEVDNLPFIDSDANKEIIALTKDILESKKKNINNVTMIQEKKIDKLIYDIFNLTEAEIKIIEDTKA